MLASLIPLFDENLAVSGYSLFVEKKNKLLEPALLGTGSNDGAGVIVGFDIINNIGTDVLSENKPILVPVNGMSIFSDIDEQCTIPHEHIVLLFDKSVKPDSIYTERIKELKQSGYKLCIRKLEIPDFEQYKPVISLLDYIILDYKKIANIDAAKTYFSRVYPNIKLVAGNIDSMDAYESLTESGGYSLFEGEFYRLPVTKGEVTVAPVKINYIELLNVVNKPDFELTQAADVIGRDTALVVDLLKMVNRIAINSEITSIRHAAAMLGQRELKKWINTAVAHQLCSDRPSEVTRLSLIRAKFMENLAPAFGLSAKINEAFLTGLFSVIDLILNQPMSEAIKLVYLPKDIVEAILDEKGDLYKLLSFTKTYEEASFNEISRLLVLDEMDSNVVYDAYVDALKWFSNMFSK